MAGHSKWANIQHRKNAQDKKRSKIFTRLIREITVAARNGADPDGNPRLRLALERSQAANLPKASATRAVERGSGTAEGVAFEDVLYEGYAKGGVAILIECSTDNRNRTIAEVRHAFSKNSGTMADAGSVSYLFRHIGEVILAIEPERTEEIFDLATQTHADDIDMDEGQVRILCDIKNLNEVVNFFDEKGESPVSVDTLRVADIKIDLSEDDTKTLEQLVEALEELDDCQSVYHNAQQVSVE